MTCWLVLISSCPCSSRCPPSCCGAGTATGTALGLNPEDDGLITELDETFALLVADAQTSGGLLAAVTPRSAAKIRAALAAAGVEAFDIGRITGGRPRIVVDERPPR